MISVKNVKFAYQAKEKALDDVSFTINDQEWVSIIGHNGSGKSTISKLLVGLLEPQRGTIEYDGVLLTEESVEELRKHIGIVFQNPDNQFVGINVKYDIAFGLENRCVERTKMNELVQEYATKVDMDKKLQREPYTLSGGEKQRVAIAGILAMNTDYIILDEATSMLDPEGTKEIISLISELKSKYHKTVITITHDLKLAEMSDRIIVLKQGKIIKEGTPMEIFSDRELLKSSNLDMPFGLKVHTLAGLDPVIKENEKVMNALWEYHLMK